MQTLLFYRLKMPQAYFGELDPFVIADNKHFIMYLNLIVSIHTQLSK